MAFEPLTLAEISEGKRRTGRPVRILCEGVFDLFHIGHVEVLRQAKQAFPDVHLVVGVSRDEEVLKYKGGRTVMSFKERVQSVKECKYVDEVLDDMPFYFTVEFLNSIQCDLVAHDALPYNTNGAVEDANADFYARFKSIDRFLITQRTEGISTTDLIQRILDSRKDYIERNAKRGLEQSSTAEVITQC